MDVIDITNQWYTNTECSFHKRVTVNDEQYDLEKLNFAKTLCEDDAKLIEVIEINVGKNDESNNIVNNILKKNKFATMYRQQIEEMSANGTVGCYLRVENAELYSDGLIKGGNIVINYCDTLNIAPLTVINNEIVECAFSGVSVIDSKTYNVIVIFTKENGKYKCESVVLNNNGKKIESLSETIKLGEVKPFAIMRVAAVNNLKMKGYGYPKLLKAIPNLEILDLSYTMWKRDLEKSDKIVFVNENICDFDDKGKPIPPSKEKKKIFIQLGRDKLPEEKSLWQEYNPTVRVAEATDSIERALSMLSLSFGYGTKKYTFEQGRIVTATEYVGERQDVMQVINRQRSESKDYITDIVNAIAYFYESLNKQKLQIDEVMVDFDDSYIEDRSAMAESLKNDALAFDIPKLKLWYFMKKYNLTEKEAQELLNEIPSNDEGDDNEE